MTLALLGGLCTPRRPGTVGGGDRALGLGRTHVRHRAERFAGRGIGDREGRAALGVEPGAVDVGLSVKEFRVFE